MYLSYLIFYRKISKMIQFKKNKDIFEIIMNYLFNLLIISNIYFDDI